MPDEALERLREPRSPMMPDAPMPPSIAAPSPSAGASLGDTPPGRAEPPSPKATIHGFHTQPSPQAPFAASRPSPTPGKRGLPMALKLPVYPSYQLPSSWQIYNMPRTCTCYMHCTVLRLPR